MHPQTVIEHFGTWNAAKRAAGLTPRRFISREELLEQLRQLGDELGRTPTAQGSRREPAADGLQVADLAHVRLVDRGAQGGGVRRAGWRREAGARGRAGSGARTRRSAPAEDGRLEGRATRRPGAACPSGRSIDWSTSRRARGPHSSSSCASACARRASRWRPTARCRGWACPSRRAPCQSHPARATDCRRSGEARLAPTRSAWRAWRGRKRPRAARARRGAACRRGRCDRRESASRS